MKPAAANFQQQSAASMKVVFLCVACVGVTWVTAAWFYDNGSNVANNSNKIRPASAAEAGGSACPPPQAPCNCPRCAEPKPCAEAAPLVPADGGSKEKVRILTEAEIEERRQIRLAKVVESVKAYESGNLTREEVCAAGGHEMPKQPLISASSKRVIVTGAAGFIGSHVVRECAALGMDVLAVDDMSGGFIENIPKHPKVKFVLADVKDAQAMEDIFVKHGPFDYVYHLAAYAAEGLSHFIRSYNYRNNLVGSVELLNAALRHKSKCVVFASSIAAYGAPQPPITEESPMHPEDPYGIAKYSFEMDLQTAKELFDMDFVILRLHNVYGPHQNIADKYRNVIGIFMNQILNDKAMTIFGDGKQTRAFSYINDVAPIVAKSPLVPEARNQRFNVGAETPSSLNLLAKLVGEAMSVPSHPIRHLEKRFEVAAAEATHAKVKCFFDPGRQTPLLEGLITTAKWVKARTKGFKPVEFNAVEVKEKMPPSWVRPDLEQHARVEHTAANNTNFDQSGAAVTNLNN